MERTIIQIDEDLCNGCGLCVEGCHEGALQMIDGKARMISDLYCDGLGACIPECPVNAISLIEREAEPYDEVKVMGRIAPKGEATILAHLNHLIDFNEKEYVEQGIQYIKDHSLEVDLSRLKDYPTKENNLSNTMDTRKVKENIAHDHTESAVAKVMNAHKSQQARGGGCPGARMMQFGNKAGAAKSLQGSQEASATGGKNGQGQPSALGQGQPSALGQWPVQMHLVHPNAPYFRKADVLLAADCVAFAMGDFHSKHLSGKGLAIACPKLDQNKQVYIDKLKAMINEAEINTLTVMVMEVPCCTGLLQMAQQAAETASRKVPVKAITVSLQGEVIREEWL